MIITCELVYKYKEGQVESTVMDYKVGPFNDLTVKMNGFNLGFQ